MLPLYHNLASYILYSVMDFTKLWNKLFRRLGLLELAVFSTKAIFSCSCSLSQFAVNPLAWSLSLKEIYTYTIFIIQKSILSIEWISSQSIPFLCNFFWNCTLAHCVKSVRIRYFSGRIFPHLDWIRRETGPEKFPMRTLFMQWRSCSSPLEKFWYILSLKFSSNFYQGIFQNFLLRFWRFNL